MAFESNVYQGRTSAVQPRRFDSALSSQASALEMRGHGGRVRQTSTDIPTGLPFEGCLTLVDVASDRAPSGARGHRVVLTRAAAEVALAQPARHGRRLQSRLGRPRRTPEVRHHHRRPQLDDKRLMVAGYLFARDFPEMEAALSMQSKGGDGHELRARRRPRSRHARQSIWTLTRATFTGAAILLRDKAAYRATSFQLQATRRQPRQAAASRGGINAVASGLAA